MVSILIKTLKWPVVTLLLIGSIHFIGEAVMPELKNLFVPTVIAAILIPIGVWAGYNAGRYGGNFGTAALAGAILGLLPLMLDVFGFGILLGRGVPQGLAAGLFGFAMVFFGALVGGGFYVSRPERAL